MARPITLARGIIYPAAVTKAYADQQDAEAAYTAAVAELAEAEAQAVAAGDHDRQALSEAARTGSGHPGKERLPDAQRAVAYATEVHTQAQDRYGAAADVADAALAANAEAIVPLAIEAARTALATYADTTAQIHQLITAANAEIQNAVHGLNVLRPHVAHLAVYRINQLPAAATIPASNQLGNLEPIIGRLEAALKAHADQKKPQPDQ